MKKEYFKNNYTKSLLTNLINGAKSRNLIIAKKMLKDDFSILSAILKKSSLIEIEDDRGYHHEITIDFIEYLKKEKEEILYYFYDNRDALISLLNNDIDENLEVYKNCSNLFRDIEINCSCKHKEGYCEHTIIALTYILFILDKYPILYFELKGFILEDFYNTLFDIKLPYKSKKQIDSNPKDEDLEEIDNIRNFYGTPLNYENLQESLFSDFDFPYKTFDEDFFTVFYEFKTNISKYFGN